MLMADRGSLTAVEAAVVAAQVEERLAIVDFDAFDFGDKDGVIAGDVGIDDVAGEVHQGVVEEWNAALRPTIANAEIVFERGVVFGLREIFGDGLLMVLEDVHTETFVALHQGKELRGLTDADEDKQRVQGNRGERVRRHAVNLAGGALGGDYGDAGGELPEGEAKLGSAWRGWRHRGIFEDITEGTSARCGVRRLADVFSVPAAKNERAECRLLRKSGSKPA